MGLRFFAGLCLTLVTSAVWSQRPADPSEWIEESAQAPAYSKDKLIPIEMPPYVTVKVGIDPDTLTVGVADGVLRYVVVMQNTSGSFSAAYEGILCSKGEVKTYARIGTNGQWAAIANADWRPLTDNLPSRHAYAIAKQGGCDGRTAGKREDTLRVLRRSQSLYN